MPNTNTTIRYYKKIISSILLFTVFCCNAYSNNTVIEGVVKDAITGELLEFASIRFDKSSIGGLSDEKGEFHFSNPHSRNIVIVSLMGYETWTDTVPVGKTTKLTVLLNPVGIKLDEVVIRPDKEKYSKKNNPAVTLIKNVIANKYKYLPSSRSGYKREEYDRMFLAFNDFSEKNVVAKKMGFVTKYIDSSRIDRKPILPFSLRETLSTYYYRKDPEATKRIVTAHKNEGIDQGMNQETIEGVLKELFADVNITDNNINLLFRDFISPLSSNSAVNFYKWYIMDTVKIEEERFVKLGFVPFNTRDIGFSGYLYVTTDSTFALKRISMTVPVKSNINFVEAMVLEQDFERVQPDLWIPKEFVMAIDISAMDAVKIYVEKIKTFSDYDFNKPIDVVFLNPAPEVYVSNYKKQTKEYWDKHRPAVQNKDYEVGTMMEDFMKNKLVNTAMKAVNIITYGYIPTSSNEEKNKLDLGTTLTFFSFNGIEGGRFRLTAATTNNFHKRLFLYGYAAYGTKDQKFKYMGEAAWAFNQKEKHKNEFPIHDLTFSYTYDINPLGQRFLGSERDNIFMSGTSNGMDKVTYSHMAKLSYKHEFYSGFAYDVYGISQNETPVGTLQFWQADNDGNRFLRKDLQTTELGLDLRYAHNEKFFQQYRTRKSLPSLGFIFELTFKAGMKALGGDYSYQIASLDVKKEFVPFAGSRLITNVQYQKLWGEAPFTSLITPNVNNSKLIQKTSFHLLNPMEFLHDSQVNWDITYRMGGIVLNRIPLIKKLKWREVIGFRGFWGKLSEKNNPTYNHNLLLFPNDIRTLENVPYMEMNFGVENIFKILRVDYFTRLNYRSGPNIDKDGFRISLNIAF